MARSRLHSVVVVLALAIVDPETFGIVHSSAFQLRHPKPTSRASTSTLFRKRRHPALPPKPLVRSNLAHKPLFSTPETVVGATEPTLPIEEEGIGAWIPLASVRSLTGLGPQRITVMGVDLVVWHTTEEEGKKKTTKKKKKKKKKKGGEAVVWSAQVDACTHRLAPLSQGRVDPKTNCIECPYHGWQFNSHGNVTAIPQLESDRSLQSVRNQNGNLKTFPVHAVGDLLFVFLPSSLHGEMFPQSLLPEHQYPHLTGTGIEDQQMFVRDLPYSFDMLVENFMDPAHIPFAHHSLQSVRSDGGPTRMTKLVSNFTHVEASYVDKSRNRTRDGFVSFQRPAYYHFGEYTGEGVDEATGKAGREPKLKIYVAPVSAGKCRIFMYKLGLKVPMALIHAGSSRFLNTDIWLHDAERAMVKRKEDGMGRGKLAGMDYISASQSDTGVAVFRKWWETNGMADSPPHTFGTATMAQLGPTPLTRAQQIDPWENHTKHCSTCRRSLTLIKKVRAACVVLALVGTAAVRKSRAWGVLGVLGVVVSLYVRDLLGRFATAIEGNPERSKIADRSVAAAAE